MSDRENGSAGCLSFHLSVEPRAAQRWEITAPVAVEFDGLQSSSIKIRADRGDKYAGWHWLA
jgi:hypothetical protein